LLIALSAKKAIPIVEVARQWRARGEPIIARAVAAARAGLRTSFALILSVMPVVFATGAGASARRSISITVFWRDAVAGTAEP
jgi:hydrophobic/amphiphilic exporter-1 (mainly G- bacteria), HAE1 family